MVNAVSNSVVPKFNCYCGKFYGNYAMWKDTTKVNLRLAAELAVMGGTHKKKYWRKLKLLEEEKSGEIVDKKEKAV
jgi:acetyl-CoA carboxylase carboxyltransferase component